MAQKKETNDPLNRQMPLRERAEELLRIKAADVPVMTMGDVQSLVYELGVHQIELEIQNEELRQAQVELAQSRDRYSDLYEYAPVGYLTLNQEGKILEANLTAATMLGVKRQDLVYDQMTKFLARDSQDDFYRHRQALNTDEMKQTCELNFQTVNGAPGVLRLESVPYATGGHRHFRTALTDVTARKQAERRLEHQERFNRRTLDALSANVAVIDSTGAIVATNRAWRSFAEANGAPWQIVGDGANYLAVCDKLAADGDSDARTTARAIRRVLTGEEDAQGFEYPCHSADEQRWFYCRITRFSSDGEAHLVIAHENITAMKQAQEQLEFARARFETLQTVSPVAILFFETDGKCIEVNTRWCEMFGVSREAAYGDGWRTAVHPDDRMRVSDQWNAAAGAGESAHMEFRALGPGGTVLWLVSQSLPIRDASGCRSGFIQVLVDLTDQKRAERALLFSEVRLRAVMKSAADAIITIDETGTVESFNEAAERMFGYATDEMIGQNVRILMPSPYFEEHDGYLKRFKDTGVKRVIGVERELTGRRKDGAVFPLDLSINVVDHLNLYVGVLRDITQRKHLEQQIVEIATLEQQRIGQDLHDSLGQQLTGLILLAQHLVESAENAMLYDDVSQPIETVMRSRRLPAQAERLRAGLENALHEIRTVCNELTPVPINEDGLVVALDRLVANVSRDSLLTCTFDCPVHVGLDNVTATHLFHVAQGAISNAMRHSQARRIQVRLERNQNELILAIRDDGIGLPPLGAAGLGMRIMQNRAKIIGGILAIRTIQPTGTEVTCTIPKT